MAVRDVDRRSRARSPLEAEDVDVDVDECLGGFARPADGQISACSSWSVCDDGDDLGFVCLGSGGGFGCVMADVEATRSQESKRSSGDGSHASKGMRRCTRGGMGECNPPEWRLSG